MPRAPRFRLPGYPQHIVQRGNARQACFFEDRDYRYYLKCLEEASLTHGCAVHAYVLMTNHVHLLVTPDSADGISRLMQGIGRKYVKTINERHDRTGSLWDGRYKSTLVDTDEYLLACYRYIELNPVRAGLVSNPDQYPWSSYGFHVGRRFSNFVRDHEVFLNLGADRSDRVSAYLRLFETELSEERLMAIRNATRKSRPLGSNRFQAAMSEKLGIQEALEPWGGPRAGSGRPKAK